MNPSFYQMIGGEAPIRILVDRFYDLMDSEAEYDLIRKLHPLDLQHSREKLYLFLVGWMGGPPVYIEKFGHPRLRARHLPFSIGANERDQWLGCMQKAMHSVGTDDSLRRQLYSALVQIADFMRNRVD